MVALAILLFASAAPAAEFVQAVEFPYHQFPRHLWERELVWVKNIGIKTVAFTIPADGAANDPRNDLAGFLRLLRTLGLRAWIQQAPRSQLAALAPQMQSHGGPIAFVEGGAADAPGPPTPVVRLAATDPQALLRSRQAFATARGSLLWTDVEDLPSRRGVVSYAGQERAGAAVLRRDAALLKYWGAILPNLRTQRTVNPKLGWRQLYGGANTPGAIHAANSGEDGGASGISILDPRQKRKITLPTIDIPAADALWLPVNVPLATGGLCEDCTAFALPDRVVYATAELHAIEQENGILAMEFYAPREGEVLVQLSRKPSGPLLAGGHPTEFTWDETAMTVRLPVPAGKPPQYRVRIGLAIEPPDSSAFFNDPGRLIIGRSSVVSTSYSSEDLAGRSRLRVPPGFLAKALPKSPLEIDYEITPPATALHGEFVPVALEADGVRLGRARLQVMRAGSIRIVEAQENLPVDPPRVAIDATSGRNLRVIVRNNSTAIENYVLEASGPGLTFLPARSSISVGGKAEREVSIRVFAEGNNGDLRPATLRLSGGASFVQPVQIAVIPRSGAVSYSVDLNGDGVADWVLENNKVRAAFSGVDGRWIEFVWKGSGVNLLPDSGTLPLPGRAQFRSWNDGGSTYLEALSARGKRTMRLSPDGGTLVVEQDSALAAGPAPVTLDGITLSCEPQSPARSAFSLAPQAVQ